MTKQPTREQQRMIASADPDTGLLHGTAGQLEALVADGWAFRHPKPPRRCYLTPAGQQLRRQLLESPSAPASAAEATPPSTGMFAARTGVERAPDDARTRAREVQSAWEGLTELRRITNRTGTTEILCPWERTHPAAAAALALEAAGCAPSAVDADGRRTVGGYRVSPWPQAGTVRVEWAGPNKWPTTAAQAGLEDELAAFVQALESAGWHVSEHQQARGHARFLVASPRRV
jgi:hypothetical protein